MAQTKASKSITELIRKEIPQFKYAFIEADSILQIGLKNTGKANHNLALRVCKALKKAGNTNTKVVYLEDGDTGLGKCNCQTLKIGYNKIADRKLGYYYFAE